jgi:hypothetical protein
VKWSPLVDADLDEEARRRMPDSTGVLGPTTRAPTPPVRRRTKRTALRACVAVAAVLALLTAAVSLAVGRGADETAIRETQSSPPVTSAKAVPPLPLRWKRVPGATYYNVIIWRDGKRVLDYWPHRAVVRVPRATLRPGQYMWFVYPGFGSERARRFGELAKRGTFSL